MTRPLLWTGHLKEAEQAGKSSFERSCYFERQSEERAQTVLPDQVEMRFDLASWDLGFTDIGGKSVTATTRNGVVMQEILVGCFRLSHLTYAETEPEQTPTSWATRTSACPRPRAG